MKYTYYSHSPDELKHVRPAREVARDRMDSCPSPFLKKKRPIATTVLDYCLRWIERSLGIELYVENYERELALFSSPVKHLLETLYLQEKIEAWEMGKISYSYPPVISCVIKPTAIVLPSGGLVTNEGLLTRGTATEPDAAMKTALAEFFERDAISVWENSFHIRSRYEDLAEKAVDPNTFLFGVRDEQTGNLKDSMWWRDAYDVGRNRYVCIPAQLTYLFYRTVFPNDPQWHRATSNGVAAYTTREGASVRAFYELMERDAFLKYWLTSTSPKKIDLATVDIPENETFLSALQDHEIEAHLLDCRTEFRIPVLVMVLIDRERSGAIQVSAEAGYDTDRMISKLCRESAKLMQLSNPEQIRRFVWNKDGSNIHSISERRSLWSQPAMIEAIRFFITGESITYQQYCSEIHDTKLPRDLRGVRAFIREHKLDGYEVDQTTDISKRNGIYISRYIIPELLPMYFREEMKPVNAPRLRNFHKNMHISDTMFDESNINLTPHPFP